MAGRVEDFTTRVVRAIPVDIVIGAVKFVEPDRPGMLAHWERDEDGEDETVGLVFTAGAFASIADEWGDLDSWMEAVSGKIELRKNEKTGKEEEVLVEAPKNPLGAIVRTLAIVLNRDPAALGVALSMEAIPEYSAALLAGMQIAQGVDPTFARRIGKRITNAKSDPNAGLAERLAALEAEDAMTVATSPSTPGAGTGSDPAEMIEISG